MAHDTSTGSLNDLIRFAKANRSAFTHGKSRKSRRCLRLLDQLVATLLRMQGVSHDPRIQQLNERAVNLKLATDMANPSSIASRAPSGLAAGMMPFYMLALLDTMVRLGHPTHPGRATLAAQRQVTPTAELTRHSLSARALMLCRLPLQPTTPRRSPTTPRPQALPRHFPLTLSQHMPLTRAAGPSTR